MRWSLGLLATARFRLGDATGLGSEFAGTAIRDVAEASTSWAVRLGTRFDIGSAGFAHRDAIGTDAVWEPGGTRATTSAANLLGQALPS